MRVISQDGTIDVPYEMVVIQRYREAVYFSNCNLTEDLIGDIKLAEYSTEAKAIKAVEMLRTKYRKFQEITSENGRYFAFNYPKVFQFPQDSEV